MKFKRANVKGVATNTKYIFGNNVQQNFGIFHINAAI